MLYPQSQKTLISRHVIFDETVFPYKNTQALLELAHKPCTITTYSEFVNWNFPSVEHADEIKDNDVNASHKSGAGNQVIVFFPWDTCR